LVRFRSSGNFKPAAGKDSPPDKDECTVIASITADPTVTVFKFVDGRQPTRFEIRRSAEQNAHFKKKDRKWALLQREVFYGVLAMVMIYGP
jgi:hypothetical protein